MKLSRLVPLLVLLLLQASCSWGASAMPADSTMLRDSIAAGDTLRPEISTSRLVVLSGLTGAGLAGGYVLQSNLWWKGERSAFHTDWKHDWSYALGADKLGHFYFPYLVATLYGEAFAWCGIDTAQSLWLAGGLAVAHQTFVEMRDGFSAEWGFSWGDFAANVLGAAYPIAAREIPALRAMEFKISYWPSERFKAGGYGAIIDDYESTYHWVSINVRELLPRTWREYYPAWLNVAAGHSVKELDLQGGGTHEIYLSLDLNLKGLPGDGWFWNLLKNTLNLYHLPAPAVRIYPGVVWYGVHF